MVLLASTPVANPSAKIPQTTGIRKNGKTWKPSKAPFRNTTSSSKNQYAKRVQRQTQEAAVKAAEKQLRAEKEEERERRVQAIKDRRAAKEERERFELMEQKMHKKRVERVKRREKRNKMLKS